MKKDIVYVGEGGLWDGIVFVGHHAYYIDGTHLVLLYDYAEDENGWWYSFIFSNKLMGTKLVKIGTL